jgi:enoyl-CoA hydratase/carnithine racemase
MTRDLLLTGRMIDARDALAAGLATLVVPSGELQQEAFKIAAELSTRAGSTIKATKAMLIRLRDHRRPPQGVADDIVRECYGSQEFREGVAAFLDGRKPNWY